MKRMFSVLLPTKNRLSLLKSAVETVRRQTCQDWEIIIADNCSSDDIGGYVQSLNDSRIVVTRSDVPLPVTDNWNRAYEKSRGQYVVMLGDDDGLVPDYFDRVAHAINVLDEPDVIYHGAYHFAFPGVIPGNEAGYLVNISPYYDILRDCPSISVLPTRKARHLAAQSLNLIADYGFNMQHFLFKRSFLIDMEKSGNVFQGPFPDFYVANLAMLTAHKIGRIAEPLVIIGISPKSYGYYHFNNNETEGKAFLEGDSKITDAPSELRDLLLPGSNMDTSWLLSVALIPKKLAPKNDISVNVRRYRRIQINKLIQRKDGRQMLAAISAKLSLLERCYASLLKLVLQVHSPKFLAKAISSFIKRSARQYPKAPRNLPPPVVGQYSSILEVFEGLEAKLRSKELR